MSRLSGDCAPAGATATTTRTAASTRQRMAGIVAQPPDGGSAAQGERGDGGAGERVDALGHHVAPVTFDLVPHHVVTAGLPGVGAPHGPHWGPPSSRAPAPPCAPPFPPPRL